MTIEEAAAVLSDMYLRAAPNEKVIQIHLFGIKYADAIQNMSPSDIAVRANLPKSYGTEINKGRNLARFVRVAE